jgi:hypothetical protein
MSPSCRPIPADPEKLGSSRVVNPWHSVPGRPAAIDENRIARNKGRCTGGKEYDRSRHIHRLTNAV